MALAVYRKGSNSYLLERVLFPGENTEELFREIRNKRDQFMISTAYRKSDKYPAFTIAGLSEDLKVLDAALMLSDLPRLERKVEMLIVDMGLNKEFLQPALMESDVVNAKLNISKGKP